MLFFVYFPRKISRNKQCVCVQENFRNANILFFYIKRNNIKRYKGKSRVYHRCYHQYRSRVLEIVVGSLE